MEKSPAPLTIHQRVQRRRRIIRKAIAFTLVGAVQAAAGGGITYYLWQRGEDLLILSAFWALFGLIQSILGTVHLFLHLRRPLEAFDHIDEHQYNLLTDPFHTIFHE